MSILSPRAIGARVNAGAYELVLGDPAGMVLSPLGGERRPEPRELLRAIEAPSEKGGASPPRAEAPKLLTDASDITDKAEHAVDLFTKIAQGRLGADAVSGEVEKLVELLERLDREGRWREALRVARSLAMLLALLSRWVELVASLRVALQSAEQLADEGARAWALHELGTLHLAAEKLPEADTELSRALELREKLGERSSVAVTERNLRVLCQTLRAKLHGSTSAAGHEPRSPRRIALLAFALVPLLVGGAAGAVIRGSSEPAKVAKGSSSAVVQTHPHHHRPQKTKKNEEAKKREEGGKGGHSQGQASTTLTIQKSGEGTGTVSSEPSGIDCGESCSHRYPVGQRPRLTAKAGDDSHFAEWAGACTGSGICEPDLSTGKTVTARFDPEHFKVEVARTGDGAGTVSSSDERIECGEQCSATYEWGAPISLKADQDRGSTFDGWGEACSSSGSQESCELTLHEKTVITAEFGAG
ncbi:MAG TPA: hypothetical protein VL988_03920 [Solirubrobacteraceae bacterium]|nr:hypothetical protein [Solirubrobacteraceae bacterium]